MKCTDTTYTPFAEPNEDNWHYDTDTAYGAWSRCTYADYAVRGVFGCGWRIMAHRDSYYNLHCCEHHWRSPLAYSDNSRYADYQLARTVFDAMQDLFCCLWAIRLANWDDPGHLIERAFTPVWNHSLAAYDAAKRTLQVEDAFYWRQCVADPYNSECLEVM